MRAPRHSLFACVVAVAIVAIGVFAFVSMRDVETGRPETAREPDAAGSASVRAAAWPLTAEAYRQEFRYLRSAFRRTDLSGPAVKTDGWSSNIPEAEWPFMAVCYFGYACAELAREDAVIREEALEEMRWITGALQTPRLTGFMAENLGEPFGADEIHPSAFVHGHFLNVAVRYREVSRDGRYDAIIGRVAETLLKAYEASDEGILPSYPDMWWLSDNFVAMAGLKRYGDAFGRDTSGATAKIMRAVRLRYLDADTGMFCTYLNAPRQRRAQRPRGISLMYGLHFIKDFEPEFARGQYGLAKRHFIRERFGLAGAREFPEGDEAEPDVDSGPVVFGLGLSASGFAVAAAANMGDYRTAESLLRASVLVGGPHVEDGRLR